MRPVASIAASGMNTAQFGLSVAAHNLANLNTAGFRRQEAVQATVAEGGVASTVRRVAREGPALEADVVAQLQARNAFLANLAVFRSADSMLGSLLDTVG